MTQQPTNLPTPTCPLPNRLPIFGPPPLLAGEDSAAYDDLLARVSGNLKPSDIFEEIWVREIVDLTWETLRWRRHQADLVKAVVPQLLEKILKPLVPSPVARDSSFMSRMEAVQESLKAGPDLVAQWASREPTAIKRVDELLRSAGMTMDSVVAQAVVHELDKIGRFNRLITSAEWRRNATLREIDRRRATFAERLRNEVDKIEDADFKTIEADAGALTSAANHVTALVPTEDAA